MNGIDVYCRGTRCPLKEKCGRYTPDILEDKQYFIISPFKLIGSQFNCDMFWGENSEALWKQLNNIVDGK